MAYSIEQLMKEGRAAEKGITEADVDPQELKMGIEVEYEHTTNEEVSKKIALDHLAELPDYYTRLKAMEEEGKEALKVEKESFNQYVSNLLKS